MRTQVLGALVLAMALVGVSGNWALAGNEQDLTQAQSEAVRAAGNGNTELGMAISKAEEARAYAAKVNSQVYAGIPQYIDRLLETAQKSGADEEKVIDSLNDATELTYQLLGKPKATAQARESEVVAMYEQQNETVQLVKADATEEKTAKMTGQQVAGVVDKELLQEALDQKNNNSRPGVGNPVAVNPTENTSDEMEEADEGETVADEKTEPKKESTKPAQETEIIEHKAGWMEILIGGGVVLLLGAGITVLMIRSRRNA